MTNEVAEAAETFDRRPILPLEEIMPDRVYAFWPWYLYPFRPPKLPPEAIAWVESGMTGKVAPSKVQVWQRRLAGRGVATIKCDAAAAMTRKPGGLAADREAYKRRGFLICQRVEGEVGSSEFGYQSWPPTMESGPGYIGSRAIIEELKRRLPWGIAQVTARIAETERRMERRGITADQLEYSEISLGNLNEQLKRLQSGSVPLAEELFAFFLEFERLRIQSSQDGKYKEEMDKQNKIAAIDAQIDSAMSTVRETVAAGAS